MYLEIVSIPSLVYPDVGSEPSWNICWKNKTILKEVKAIIEQIKKLQRYEQIVIY